MGSKNQRQAKPDNARRAFAFPAGRKARDGASATPGAPRGAFFRAMAHGSPQTPCPCRVWTIALEQSPCRINWHDVAKARDELDKAGIDLHGDDVARIWSNYVMLDYQAGEKESALALVKGLRSLQQRPAIAKSQWASYMLADFLKACEPGITNMLAAKPDKNTRGPARQVKLGHAYRQAVSLGWTSGTLADVLIVTGAVRHWSRDAFKHSLANYWSNRS